MDGAKPITINDQAETRDIDCRLTRGGTISGKVTRDSDGEAVSAAIVTAYTKTFFFSAPTDSAGRYRLSPLDDGEYYLRASSRHSLADRYYPDTYREDEAVAISVSRGTERGGVDFKLENGAGISGHVRRADDGKPVIGATVSLFSAGWTHLKTVFCDGTGRYLVPGVGPGDYYLSAYGPGFAPQYYPSTSTREEAEVVKVAAEQDLVDLDFALKNGAIFLNENAIANDLSSLMAFGTPGDGSHDLLILPSDALGRFADVEPGRAFHDPYRGVKIEVIGKEGSGADARARLRVSLSDIRLSSPLKVNFQLVRVGSTRTENLTLTNGGSRTLTIGQTRVGGRNADQFQLATDFCSGAVLSAKEACSVSLSFKPTARHSPAGEFAFVTFPCDDPIRPLASVTLTGISWGTDLTLFQSHRGDFMPGSTGTFDFTVINRGPDTTAGEIEVTGVLVDGLTLGNVIGSADWLCSSEGQMVRCIASKNLAVNAVSQFSLEVIVGDRTPRRFVNKATLSYREDIDTSNNEATDAVDVRVPSRLRRQSLR